MILDTTKRGGISHRRATLSLVVLLMGYGYLRLVSFLGWGIPCPFYAVTSCQCPACGVTRMAACLLRGDWASAYHYNAGLLVLSPLIIMILLADWLRWLRIERKPESSFLFFSRLFLVVLLVLWGVLRNIISLYG